MFRIGHGRHTRGLVRELAHHQGLAVVVSIHDLNLAGLYADRVALLAEGRLLAEGAPGSVLSAENLSRAYGAPVMVTQHPTYDAPLVLPVPNGSGASVSGFEK